jgi:hypothetical protein
MEGISKDVLPYALDDQPLGFGRLGETRRLFPKNVEGECRNRYR